MTTVLFYFAMYCAVVCSFMLIFSICFMPIFLLKNTRREISRIRIKFHFIAFDFWMGLYYDKKKQVVWFSPFPMMMFRIWREVKF